MSWEFDYKRAWETWARPEFLKLPEPIIALLGRVTIECQNQRQNRSLGMDWPEDGKLKQLFEAMDRELLKRAAVVIYYYGHWDSRSRIPVEGVRIGPEQPQTGPLVHSPDGVLIKPWTAPDYFNDDIGGYWKFQHFANQTTATKFDLDDLTTDKWEFYTHTEGTDLCDDEVVYKYAKLVQPMFKAIRVHICNVQVKNWHVEPHLFMIGAKHFPKDGGIYIDVHQAGCAYPKCGLPYEDHTHDRALGLALQVNTPEREARTFLKTLMPELEKDNLVGVAFHKTAFEFIKEKETHGTADTKSGV